MRIPKNSFCDPSFSSLCPRKKGGGLWAIVPQGRDWFQQQKGESDIAFIKRITSSNPPPPSLENNKRIITDATENANTTSTGYQRIEDWEAAQAGQAGKNVKSMSWEEKVQFDGQRFGNQVRQNDILIRQINSGL